MNVIPGSSTAGKNGLGITWPKPRISHRGKIRSAPSIHPRYQSGWAGDDTDEGSNGPYSQTGLICASPPSAASTPAMARNNPTDFAV